MAKASKAFICNSGSEANEAAIKFCRKVGRMRRPDGTKHEIVSFHGSFHGRTMGSLSATPNDKYQKPFGPMLPGFRYGQINDVENLTNLVTSDTCGVLIEPIQGEGGVNVASSEFLHKLRTRCNEVGAVLVYDEIQCGMSRTGTFWAHSELPSSSHPDVITTAKALGNGFPIGAAIVTEEVANCIITGDHGTTFGGNPLASRIGHYLVSRLSSPEILETVKAREKVFRKGFAELQRRFPQLITEVRGRGLILGLQLTRDPTPIVTAARERGLLIITCGTNTLRFVPPLIISEQEIKDGLAILADSMQAATEADASIPGTKGQQEMAPPGR